MSRENGRGAVRERSTRDGTGATAGMDWAAYAETSRRLAGLRARDTRRRDLALRREAGARAVLEPLRRRLVAQRDHLAGLAPRLRLPAPVFTDVVPSGVPDVDRATRDAVECLDRADGFARAARQRAEQPALLPGLPPVARNALVYAAATVVASILSWGLFRSSGDGRLPLALLPWSLCGLPAVAFFAGYLVLVLFGRPGIDTGRPAGRSVRLGWLICCAGMLATTFLLVVTSG